MLRSTVLSVRSRCQRLIGSFWLRWLKARFKGHADLDGAWEVLAEAVQTVMRRHGLPEPYEQLKAFTRGQPMTRALMLGFVAKLDLPEADKARLLAMTPGSYTGLAAALARGV